MAASGGFSAPGTGSVYRIRYTKTPAVPALSEGSFITLAALLFLAGALMSAGRH
jgi:hypothetical protein